MKKPSLKNTFLLAGLCFILISSNRAYAQPTFGEAAIFDYNAAGDRITRYFTVDALINYKKGDTSSKVDTVVKKTEANNNEVIVRAYPNPVQDLLTVENLSWTVKDIVNVKLYDIAGNLISEKGINQAKGNIPFSGLPPGTYQVHYYLNNKIFTVWKITKV